MTHKQGFGGEGVGLDVHVGSGHLTRTTGEDFFFPPTIKHAMISANRQPKEQRRDTSPYLVDETGLSDVGVTAQEQGPGVGVDGGQTRQMLTH